MRLSIATIYGALLAGSVHAHPGHDLSEEIAERRSFINSVKRTSLSHCAEKLRARGVEARNIARRSAAVQDARLQRGLLRRDVDDVLDQSHNETDLGYTENTPPSELFSGNASCILTPEVTQGPYYVGGEYVRKDVTETQEGVDITLDYQVIDVDTCEPVPDVYVEIWHCNSTGIYSGVVASGNGETDDESNLDATFLRGIQPTDNDGVAQFQSTFPGHYTGRATHIHVMVHTNATLLANHTLGNDVYASHVGQSFFDQDLITEVETFEPYSSNTQELTTNDEDSILGEEADTDGVDPLMSYTYLGKDASEGLFAWLAFGINTTYSGEVTPAAFLYESGGVENPDSGMGGGPGGAPPGDGPPGNGSSNGTAPSNETSTSTTSATASASVEPTTTNEPNMSSRSTAGVPGLFGAIGMLLFNR